MRIIRLAGAIVAGGLLVACGDAADPLKLQPAAAPAFARNSPDSAALAKVGITWQVIKVVPPADSVVGVGETLRLESQVKFDDGGGRNWPTVVWSSSDTAVASTSKSGLVNGRRAGTALLTASIGWRGLTHRDTVRLTVGERQPDAVTPVAPVEADTVVTAPDSVDAPPDLPDESSLPQTAGAAAEAAMTTAAQRTSQSFAARAQGVTPALPRATVDTRMPGTPGRTINVRAGDALQAALDRAQPGDQVLLQNGATFQGSFYLRRKSGSGWIVIRPASMSGIPAAGTRVSPANAAVMPKLVMTRGNDGAVRAMSGAGYYRLVGLELTVSPAVRDLNAIVRLHVDKAKEVAQLPHHIVLDRTYVHGQPGRSVTRCVMMNSAATAVVDSYLSECHARNRDSQAISAWTSPGPFKIENNFLEGAGENVMFGGAKAESPEMVPSDIEIRGNHFFKPLAWRASDEWAVKNLLEIKQGQRVLIEDNVFENNWVDAQTGRALLIRAADQELSPWSRTSDITVRYNVFRNTPAVFNIDAQGKYETTRRVLVTQNVIYDVGDRSLGRSGDMFQISGKPMQDITIDRNTAVFGDGGNRVRRYAFSLAGGPHQRLSITNNVVELGSYGVRGSGERGGVASMEHYAPGGTFGGNVFVGSAKSSYGAQNRVVPSLDALNLVAPAAAAASGAANLQGLSSSRMVSALGSSTAGADVQAVMRRTARALDN